MPLSIHPSFLCILILHFQVYNDLLCHASMNDDVIAPLGVHTSTSIHPGFLITVSVGARVFPGWLGPPGKSICTMAYFWNPRAYRFHFETFCSRSLLLDFSCYPAHIWLWPPIPRCVCVCVCRCPCCPCCPCCPVCVPVTVNKKTEEPRNSAALLFGPVKVV